MKPSMSILLPQQPLLLIRLFADDCVVFKKIVTESDHASLQATVVAIHDWCVKWGMALNGEKTVLLRVTRKKSPSVFSYHLNSSIIKEVDKYKYLGVTLTSNLSWGMHISEICVSAFHKLCFLKRKLKNATTSVRLLAYNACVRSKLEYASALWDPHVKKDILKLERVQRKAVRFIFGKYKRTDSPTSIIKNNKIDPLETRRKINRLLLLHKFLSGKIALNETNVIQPVMTRKTRHTADHALSPIFAKTNSYKYSFFPRTVSEWNDLPPNVVNANNFSQELERYFCDL